MLCFGPRLELEWLSTKTSHQKYLRICLASLSLLSNVMNPLGRFLRVHHRTITALGFIFNPSRQRSCPCIISSAHAISSLALTSFLFHNMPAIFVLCFNWVSIESKLDQHNLIGGINSAQCRSTMSNLGQFGISRVKSKREVVYLQFCSFVRLTRFSSSIDHQECVCNL